MATPNQAQLAPYAVPGDETADDTTTAVDGLVDITIAIQLQGTVAQVQADWATLAATNFASPAAQMSY